MSSKIKFIHTADIHLGSLLHIRRKLDSSYMDIFNNGVYYAFKNLCDAAIKEEVDFILISGDLYDREARSVKGNSFFIEQCNRLKEKQIKVYVIGGNHDPVNEISELFNLPANVHIFSSKQPEVIEYIDKRGNTAARIIGQSYRSKWESRRMHLSYAAPADDVLNIGLLHTQLDNSSSYVPSSLQELKNIESIHYWALGHIHKREILSNEPTAIAYSGMPQGTDFGEEGLGGALLIEAQDNVISSVKFIPSALVVWKNIRIELDKSDEVNNLSDLEKVMLAKAEELLQEETAASEKLGITVDNSFSCVKGFAVRWTITGRSPIYEYINDKEDEIEEYLIESLNSRLLNKEVFIYTDSLGLNILRAVDNLEELKNQNSVIKQISSFSKQCLENEEKREELIKRLGSLWERAGNPEDINIKKLQLDDELLKKILMQAEQLAIDSILQRSEEI